MIVGITPGDGRDLVPWVAALAELDAVVLREARAVDRLIDAWPTSSRPIVHLRTPGARGLLGRVGVGLHLPAGVDPAPFRAEVHGLLGVSCHDAAEVDRALWNGADYAVLSPVFRPRSKAGDDRTPLGPDRFVAIGAGRPVLALGGMTATRWRRLRSRGAWGCAVLGDLFGCATPVEAGERLAAFTAHSQV